jgi:pimeloyl-ACP methyl ester carboxylesterase
VPYATSNGIRIAYDDAGRGEPALLLLPGWCANRTVFRYLAPLSSPFRRTLTLDWRGHGESELPHGDFGFDELLADALAVLEASGAGQVLPVALAHAGWVAVELRRRLAGRVPGMVLLEWLVLGAPPEFSEIIEGMQDPTRWRHAVDAIFSAWLPEVDNPQLVRFVREEMGSQGFAMWARAAREIAAAYARAGSPLEALAGLDPPPPVLHLYAQPEEQWFYDAQRQFAAAHPWYQVRRLEAHSHFPMFEAPGEIVAGIQQFIAGLTANPPGG